jgi:hypothetical protein
MQRTQQQASGIKLQEVYHGLNFLQSKTFASIRHNAMPAGGAIPFSRAAGTLGTRACLRRVCLSFALILATVSCAVAAPDQVAHARTLAPDWVWWLIGIVLTLMAANALREFAINLALRGRRPAERYQEIGVCERIHAQHRSDTSALAAEVRDTINALGDKLRARDEAIYNRIKESERVLFEDRGKLDNHIANHRGPK